MNMISHKLALKLKKAKFEQEGNGKLKGDFISCEESMEDIAKEYLEKYRKELVYVPTLSELIGACVKLLPEGDFHLEHLDGVGWQASGCRRYPTDEECREHGWPKDKEIIWDNWFKGKTPEESVAKLYLELKK